MNTVVYIFPLFQQLCYGQVVCLPWVGWELWDWVDHIL